MDKKIAKMRRAKKARTKIKELGVVRLSVHRTPSHIYAQLIDATGKVLTAASTLLAEVKQNISYGGNIAAAKAVGNTIAKAGLNVGVKRVAFDRSGFKYHGRVKALADAAREGGLEF